MNIVIGNMLGMRIEVAKQNTLKRNITLTDQLKDKIYEMYKEEFKILKYKKDWKKYQFVKQETINKFCEKSKIII